MPVIETLEAEVVGKVDRKSFDNIQKFARDTWKEIDKDLLVTL